MKIIEAMKKIKDLQRKAEDIRDKIGKYCADLDCETAVYPDQRNQISLWEQAHSDIIKEIGKLRFSIQKTNVLTLVRIELDGKFIEKSIAEWIHRRKDLASLEESAWSKLNDKGYKEASSYKVTPNSPDQIVRRRLYFDPKERDNKIELYRSEPSKIDSTLEVINAITDIIE